MKKPPRFHCFGHEHNYFGMVYNKKLGTTFFNAAQYYVDPPIALTFDIVS